MSNMKDFKKILDENFKEQSEMGVKFDSKFEYLGNVIFDFTTYDGDVDAVFAEKMIPVLSCIVNKKTFEYHKESNDNYLNYLMMVNLPFLVNKLEWGTSIRGAWFDLGKEYEIDCGRIKIKKGEIEEFIQNLIEWVHS